MQPIGNGLSLLFTASFDDQDIVTNRSTPGCVKNYVLEVKGFIIKSQERQGKSQVVYECEKTSTN